jgi:hypothetical protein
VNQLNVRPDRLTLILIILLGLFFVPMGVGLLTSAGIAHIAIGLACLALFGVVVWLVLRGRSKSVRCFSEDGLVRNDGRSFVWVELYRVVDRSGSETTGNTCGAPKFSSIVVSRHG